MSERTPGVVERACVLVVCNRLRRPHHEDTHLGEDKVHSLNCGVAQPAPPGSRCWQCIQPLDSGANPVGAGDD